MASMRDWLKGLDAPKDRVVVVHCKAGKGRSGTVACSYLISEEGWTVNDALARFTARRMRFGFGAGVSIPSQLRWIGYVDRWAKHQKLYVERQIEVLEVHVWGLRDGVKVAVEGYVDEGRTIKTFHIFSKHERHLMDFNSRSDHAPNDSQSTPVHKQPPNSASEPHLPVMNHVHTQPVTRTDSSDHASGASAVVFRPASPLVLPTSDIDIDFERRNKATHGWTMVTAVAHVWFNAFFEGRGPENHGDAADDGVFEIEWDAMDGIKGSARKGTRALDRLAVVWKAIGDGKGKAIREPREGQHVPETTAADWKGANEGKEGLGKDLGLRSETPVSANVSKASSINSSTSIKGSEDGSVGVKAHGPDGEDHIPHTYEGSAGGPKATVSDPELSQEQGIGDVGIGKVAGIVAGMKDVSIAEVEKGKAEREERKGIEG